MKAGIFEIHKLELELDSISISELQRRVSIAQMQVKEKRQRVKELQEMMVVTEAERDGKLKDIERLEVRLQGVMGQLREKQEDLHAKHIVKASDSSNKEHKAAREVQELLKQAMSGAGLDAGRTKQDEAAAKEARQLELAEAIGSVEVRCANMPEEYWTYFRVTTGLDFHGILLAAVSYYSLRPGNFPEDKVMSENEVDDHYKLVGPAGLEWPLDERVEDYLKTQTGDYFIEVEEITKVGEEAFEEESEYNSSDDEDVGGAENLLVYPPKQRRSSIILEMLSFITFVILFFIVMYSGRDINDHQMLYQVHREYLVEEEYGERSILKYLDIATWEEFWLWVEGPLSEGLFPHSEEDNPEDMVIGAPASEVADYNKLVGGIKFNQNRVKQKLFEECGLANKRKYQRRNNATDELDNFFEYCYDAYSRSSRSKETFGPVDLETGNIVPEHGFIYKKSKFHLSTAGKLASSYGNDGFMYILDPQFCPQCPRATNCYAGTLYTGTDGEDPSTSASCDYAYACSGPCEEYLEFGLHPDGTSWGNMVSNLKENNWIDMQTRSVQIDILTYNVNFDLYTSMFFLIEMSPSGYIRPAFWIETFSMDMWEGWQRNHPGVTSILQLIIACFVLMFLYIEKKEMSMARKITGGIKAYFKQLWNVVDMLVISLYIVSQLVRLYFFFAGRRRFFSPFLGQYRPMVDIARVYQYQFQFDSGIVLLLAFKLFKYFQLSASMGMLWNVLAQAGTSIMYFLFMFTLVMCAFSLMAMNLFGSVIFEYSTFYKSFVALLLTVLGQFSYEDLRRVQPLFGPVFFGVYIVFVYLVLLNIFLAILNEAYANESQRMQEERLLGGTKKVNKMKMLMSAVKKSLKERRKARAEAKKEEEEYLDELDASAEAQEASKRAAAELKSGAKKKQK